MVPRVNYKLVQTNQKPTLQSIKCYRMLPSRRRLMRVSIPTHPCSGVTDSPTVLDLRATLNPPLVVLSHQRLLLSDGGYHHPLFFFPFRAASFRSPLLSSTLSSRPDALLIIPLASSPLFNVLLIGHNGPPLALPCQNGRFAPFESSELYRASPGTVRALPFRFDIYKHPRASAAFLTFPLRCWFLT